MKVWFEELSARQRAGGIESATRMLAAVLKARGVNVIRSAESQIRLKGYHPDCIHFQGIWSPRLAIRLRRSQQTRTPTVVSPHGMLAPWALAHKRTKKKVAWALYQKRFLNRTSLLHATSTAEADQFRKLGLAAPIAVIPWGIEPPAGGQSGVFPKANSQSNAFRTVLFVGRIYPVKGLSMLVEAWAKVRPVGWRVRLVGPDEAGHRAEIESQIRDAGLNGAFEFTGPLEGQAKENAFRNADLFILPSHSENFGVAIGEALARGLPVITTRGAPWDLLETERCGWWTPVTSDGIAQALGQATSLPADVLREMGARGRKVVAERFTWPVIADRFSETYRWLLGEDTKPEFVFN
jgi:glycosyltransferase involved in cell wall biosynthesis